MENILIFGLFNLDPSVTKLIEVFIGAGLCMCGFVLKRLYNAVDSLDDKVSDIEIDVAKLKVSDTEMEKRLDRIERKIDKLLERL
jgi:hypothetical protein